MRARPPIQGRVDASGGPGSDTTAWHRGGDAIGAAAKMGSTDAFDVQLVRGDVRIADLLAGGMTVNPSSGNLDLVINDDAGEFGRFDADASEFGLVNDTANKPVLSMHQYSSAGATDCPQLRLRRHRGTKASPADVAVSDSLGCVVFEGTDNTATSVPVAEVRASQTFAPDAAASWQPGAINWGVGNQANALVPIFRIGHEGGTGGALTLNPAARSDVIMSMTKSGGGPALIIDPRAGSVPTIKLDGGVEASPAITSIADLNTGIWWSGSNDGIFSFSSDGDRKVQVFGSGLMVNPDFNAASEFRVNANSSGVTFRVDNASIGFFQLGVATQQTVTGSRGGNAALASLLTGLAAYGLVVDSSTA